MTMIPMRMEPGIWWKRRLPVRSRPPRKSQIFTLLRSSREGGSRVMRRDASTKRDGNKEGGKEGGTEGGRTEHDD